MNIKINLDTTSYECNCNKPVQSERDVKKFAGLISWQLVRNQKSLSLEQIKDSILKGYSFTGSLINVPQELLEIPKGQAGYIKGITDEYFSQTQLFCVDIEPPKKDDTRPQKVFCIDDIYKICNDNNIKPFMVYPSFSYVKNTDPRFRVLFCADRIYYQWEQASKIIHHLIDLFTGDTACSNPARFYYGTNKMLIDDNTYFFKSQTTDFTGILNDIDKGVIQLSEILDTPHITQNKAVLSGSKASNTNTLTTANKRNTAKNKRTKQDNTITTKDTPHIQAIKEWNAYKLQELLVIKKQPINFFSNYLNNDPLGDTTLQAGLSRTIICTNKKKLWDAVLYIPLNEFLGLPFKTKISCILPNHADNEPSANIFQDTKGKYFYKCFGECNRACTILTVLGLLSGNNTVECLNFIQQVFSIEIKENEYLKIQKEMLEQFADYIISDEFKIEYPIQAKYHGKTRLYHLSNFFRYTSSNLQELNEDKQGRPILICDYGKLLNIMQATSRSQVTQNLTTMQISGYIEKTKDEDIPTKILKELNSKRKANTLTNGQSIITKRTGVYSIPELTTIQFSTAEELIQPLIDNSVKLTANSRETIVRALGKEKADTLYPQYTKENERGTTFRSDHKTFKITQIIAEEIELKGYCIEKDIANVPMYYADNSSGQIVQRKYPRLEIVEQVKRSIGEICNSYGFKRTKAYKHIQEQLNFNIHNNSIIIIRDEQEQ